MGLAAQAWQRTLDVNLTGAFLMIQSVGCMMQAASPQGTSSKGNGMIINIVAGAGAGADAKREAGAYLSSKAGLAELSRQADHELSPHGVQVYAVENSTNVVKHIHSLMEAK